MFNGDDNSIKTLGDLIADGKLIDGLVDENPPEGVPLTGVDFNFVDEETIVEKIKTTIFG